jgi:hypothetical protein
MLWKKSTKIEFSLISKGLIYNKEARRFKIGVLN